MSDIVYLRRLIRDVKNAFALIQVSHGEAFSGDKWGRCIPQADVKLLADLVGELEMRYPELKVN